MKRIKGSFTVEASLVVSILLIVIAFMIRYSFDLRDEVFSKTELNEVVELYSHQAEKNTDEVSAYGNERLKNMLRMPAMQIELEENGDGCKGIMHGKNGTKTLTYKGYKPQKTMRKLTLIEALTDNE